MAYRRLLVTQEAIELAYRGMPNVNFSRDLLEPLAAIGEQGAFTPIRTPLTTRIRATA
jgi:hypothetical protein